MTKTELSKIRAAAGRKGGLAKARNAKKNKAQQAEQTPIDPDVILQAILKLSQDIESLKAEIIEYKNNKSEKNPPPPVVKKTKKPILVEKVDSKTAKQNFFAGVAASNGKKVKTGGPFDAMLKENKELDRLIKLSKT